jgi:hypothetical protein
MNEIGSSAASASEAGFPSDAIERFKSVTAESTREAFS